MPRRMNWFVAWLWLIFVIAAPIILIVEAPPWLVNLVGDTIYGLLVRVFG